MSLTDFSSRPFVRQASRFFIVGVANTVVCFGTIFIVHGLGASVGLASAAGYVLAMIQGFLLNRFWTFAGTDHATPIALQVAGFVVVNLICGTLFTQLNVVLSRLMPLLASSVLSTGAVTPLSFALNRWVVFRKAGA